jgi:hypothetical protein
MFLFTVKPIQEIIEAIFDHIMSWAIVKPEVFLLYTQV